MYTIAWIEGDGIGPEISEAALKVLRAVEEKYSLSFDVKFYDAGDECEEKRGVALPEDTIEGIRKADVSIKGPVGETAADVIVRLRQMFDLYANIRPAKNYPGLPAVKDIDIVIVRENTEGLYKGLEYEVDGAAFGIRVITERATRRIAREAARQASTRRKKVTVVHKANVLRRTCGLFARVAKEELSKYDLEFNEMYVDAASMALIRDPERFDVILTTNMFGDILSDEAAQVAGGLGMAASGNIGDEMALFEPVHGSAPDIAGRGIANPYSMILSMRMMLSWLGERKDDERLREAASDIERTVIRALQTEVKTPDLGGTLKTGEVGQRLSNLILGRGQV